jgi:hypothetical protein
MSNHLIIITIIIIIIIILEVFSGRGVGPIEVVGYVRFTRSSYGSRYEM